MKHSKNINLETLNDEELLSLRFCELPLKIENTSLEFAIKELHVELSEKGIKFLPKCYLSDEWLCPDLEPIIGIPFYLVHPSLRKLENKIMYEVEGGDSKSCMQLLRHEAGHAINYAYSLYKRKKWGEIFGPFSSEYGDTYKYRPYSKSFVKHLEGWYAQYHPDEDFAETFAVWLDPGSDWRLRYKGWKALKKLEYVDKLMYEISSKKPKKDKGKKYWDVSKMKTTLKNHYKRKKKQYEHEYSDFHDTDLTRIFRKFETPTTEEKAHRFIKHHRKDILDHISSWTGEKKYISNSLLRDLTKRSRELDLRVSEDENDSLMKLCVYVTTQIMNYIYTGGYKKRK